MTRTDTAETLETRTGGSLRGMSSPEALASAEFERELPARLEPALTPEAPASTA